jgi:hypothetical protein
MPPGILSGSRLSQQASVHVVTLLREMHVPSSDALTRLESALAAAADDLTSGRHAPNDGATGDGWESTLSRLTAAAVAHVPGTAYAGMTMRGRDGTLTSHTHSHQEIVDLDRAQSEFGEGPCVEAFGTPPAPEIHVPDLGRYRDRWPRYSEIASRAGIRGLLTFPLAPSHATPGALTFYATRPDAFDTTARTIARAFATQAAVAAYGAEQVADLRRALASRDLIGQAKGILMERFGIDDRRAFDLLVRSSQDTNMKLAEVARWLTGEVARRAPLREPVVDVGATAPPEPPGGG